MCVWVCAEVDEVGLGYGCWARVKAVGTPVRACVRVGEKEVGGQCEKRKDIEKTERVCVR